MDSHIHVLMLKNTIEDVHRTSLFSSRTNCAADLNKLTIVPSTGDNHVLPTIIAASTQ